jgi:tetratricopeptide (TPR) repeat protein
MTFNQTITNRYLYLGNIGLMLTLSRSLMFYPPLVLAFWVYYATLLYKFIPFYKNEYWSIEHSCWEQPDFFYPWQNRAVHCFQNQNFHGALGNMLKANGLKPKDWKVLYNITQIYLMVGNIAMARNFYTQAKQCTIDGREVVINNLMDRLDKWITEIEEQAKTNPQVTIDIGRFDMQR